MTSSIKNLTCGVLAIQGDVSEHVASINQVLKNAACANTALLVKQKQDIAKIDALIIPGGESTMLSRIMQITDMYEAILQRIAEHSLPIMGTCAGCALLAKKIVDNKQQVKLLNAMDIEVSRNAFGRQKESFTSMLQFNGFTRPYAATFIRGPIITQISPACEKLAEIDGKIVAARQKEFLALSFHPELTNDLRIHEYFLKMVETAFA